MKKEFSFLEVRKIIKEINTLIINGAKIDKVFYLRNKQSDNNNTYVQLYITNVGKYYLRFFNKFFFLTKEKESTTLANNTTLFLRKKLTNAKLISLKQIGNERIVDFEVRKSYYVNDQKREDIFKLIFELYGQNDFVLTDEDNKVIFSKKYKKGFDFEMDFDVIDLLNEGSLKKAFNYSSDIKLAMFLAKVFRFGKVYSNEVCLLSKIKPDSKLSELNARSIDLVIKNIIALVRKIDESQSAYIYLKDNKVMDIVPIKLSYYDKYNFNEIKHTIKTKTIESSEISISYNYAVSSQFDVSDKSLDNKVAIKKDKSKNIVNAQSKNLNSLKEKVLESESAIELIYSNYDGFLKFFETIKELSNKKDFDGIKSLTFKDYKVSSYNKKTKEVVLVLS